MRHDPGRPLEAQKALVTGGSSGIGAAIAIAFGAAGAAVGVNYRSNPEGANVSPRRSASPAGKRLR